MYSCYSPGAIALKQEGLDGLKNKSIITKGELDRREQENIGSAMKQLEKRKKKPEILNEEFVRKLHFQIFNKVWVWAGTLRLTKKNIGIDKHQIGI